MSRPQRAFGRAVAESSLKPARDRCFTVRLTAEEEKLVSDAVRAAGGDFSIGVWLRDVGLAEAKRIADATPATESETEKP